MCGVVMRGAVALPGSEATSRTKGSRWNLGDLVWPAVAVAIPGRGRKARSRSCRGTGEESDEPRSVRWAARESWGLKSPRRSDEFSFVCAHLGLWCWGPVERSLTPWCFEPEDEFSFRRGAPYPKAGVTPRWPGEQTAMEKSKRARRRKPDTAKADLKLAARNVRRAGCPERSGIRRA